MVTGKMRQMHNSPNIKLASLMVHPHIFDNGIERFDELEVMQCNGLWVACQCNGERD